MMQLLCHHDQIQIMEIANQLEVTPRQVRRYKDELELAGIYVESTTGRYGGYKLKQNDCHRIDFFISGENRFFDFNDWNELPIDNLSELMDFARLYHIHEEFRHYIKSRISKHELRVYMMLMKAIDETKKIHIHYVKKEQDVVKRWVNPYFFFEKYGITYVCCYEDQENKLIYLRLSRIHELKTSNQSFIKDELLAIREKKNIEENSGVFYHSGLTSIKFYLDAKYIDVMESLFSGQMTKVETESGKTIYQIKVEHLQEVGYKILSLGSKIEIIEPIELREYLKREATQIIQMYKDGNHS
jgi:predicted DNA-binding transcriptional regulator YafY